MKNITIPDLIDTQYHQYARYVLESRAIPSLKDGLKPVQRRALWSAIKNEKNFIKVSKLAGISLSLHPHGPTSVENAISGMAQPFAGANNVCWFDGKGAFGSRIAGPGNSIGAARYVSVKLSDAFNDILNVDTDLVNMIPNYDDTEKEPEAFLPLSPTILFNPIQGIAVGFACNILPRKVSDIIRCQQNYLEGKDFREPKVYYEGFLGEITKLEKNSWQTQGVFEKRGNKKIVITELPIGTTRENYIRHLEYLNEKDVITSYTDDCTDKFSFTIFLKTAMDDEEIYDKFKLRAVLYENITVKDFDGHIREMTVKDIIKEFTDYRFGFYLKRFKKMGKESKAEFEFKRDLLKVIKKGLFKKFPTLNKKQIHELLIENEIKEDNINRIINVPIYRFGKDEVVKLEQSLKELKKKLQNLVKLCRTEKLRKTEYLNELKRVSV